MHIFFWLLVLPGLVHAAYNLPQLKLKLAACEHALVGESVEVAALRREVREGIAARSGRHLHLSRTRFVGSLAGMSSAPTEYFEENLRGYSRAELDSLRQLRMERGLSEAAQLLKNVDNSAEDQQEIVRRAEALVAPGLRRSPRRAAVLWKAALGIDPEGSEGSEDIQSVQLTVEKSQLRLTTYSHQGTVLGVTGVHFYGLRLGFPLDLARWQAERYVGDESAFVALSRRSARLEFFRTRGTVLFARQLGPVTIGFQFYLQPLLDGGAEAGRLRADIMVINERARNLLPHGYYVYPVKDRRRNGEDPLFFGVRTDYSLATSPTPADQRAWFEGLRERVERDGD